jgi:hypothetical protein
MTAKISDKAISALNNLIIKLNTQPQEFSILFNAWVGMRTAAGYTDYAVSFADWRKRLVRWANDIITSYRTAEDLGQTPTRFNGTESGFLKLQVTVVGGFDGEPYEAEANVMLTGGGYAFD